MSQNSIVINNGTGADVRSAINAAFNSLATDFSGSVEPITKWPLMKWADLTNKILKIRNLTNTGWIEFMDLNTGYILTNTSRFVMSGSVGGGTVSGTASPYTLNANSQMLQQEIYVDVPLGKVLKIKKIRFFLQSNSLRLIVHPDGGSLYETPNHFGDLSLDQTCAQGNFGYALRIYLKNISASAEGVAYYIGG